MDRRTAPRGPPFVFCGPALCSLTSIDIGSVSEAFREHRGRFYALHLGDPMSSEVRWTQTRCRGTFMAES